MVLLVAAGALALVMGNVAEAAAIFVVVLINTAIGFVTEWRAVRSMEALRTLARVTCRLLRGGVVREAAAEGLVPGDIVVLSTGDMVPADLRLIDVKKLNELDKETVHELFANGYLGAIFAHLFSLDNWNTLLDRHARHGNAASSG